MPDVKLNTTSSIVDYLSSVKKPTDFNSRANLFKESGLGDRLGAYAGSSTQNSALLKHLQNPAQTGEIKPPINTTPPSSIGQFSLTGAPTSMGLPNKTQTSTPAVIPQKPTATAVGAINTPQATPTPPPNIPTQNAGASASESLNVARSYSNTSTSAKLSELTSSIKPPASATSTMGTAGGGIETPALSAKDMGITMPSESELADSYFNSPEFAALKEKYDLQGMSAASLAATAKENLEAKYAGDKSALETSLGRAGLFMSGIRSSQVAALAQSLAMSMNQVDRTTAQKLLESDASFKAGILDGITKVVKDAKKGNEDAIAQLNKAGLAVVGDQLVPTMEAQREARTAAFQENTAALNQAKFELSQAKTEEQLAISRERLKLAQERAIQTASAGEANSVVDTLAIAYNRGETLGSIGANQKAAVIQRAEEMKREEAVLNRPKTAEAVNSTVQNLLAGYVDPDTGEAVAPQSPADIIDAFVEEFGFSRDTATKLVTISSEGNIIPK